MLNCLISHGVGHDMKKANKDKSMLIRKLSRSLSLNDKLIEVKHKKPRNRANDKKK